MKPANPSAFPNSFDRPDCSGMTLRDYFAAQAVPTVLTQTYSVLRATNSETNDVAYIVSTFAYEVADAMLKAREVKP